MIEAGYCYIRSTTVWSIVHPYLMSNVSHKLTDIIRRASDEITRAIDCHVIPVRRIRFDSFRYRFGLRKRNTEIKTVSYVDFGGGPSFDREGIVGSL